MFVDGELHLEKAERICRNYFYAGFAGLPWLWLANAWTFHRYREQSELIRLYTTRSLILGLVGILVIILWIIIAFQVIPADSAIWVIFPTSNDNIIQGGYFASTVYSSTG